MNTYQAIRKRINVYEGKTLGDVYPNTIIGMSSHDDCRLTCLKRSNRTKKK